MLDLRVWAALCDVLREKLPSPPHDDLELQRADTRTVETTGYQLAEKVWSMESGKHYQLLRRSLIRLAGTRAVVHVIERNPELAIELLKEGFVALVGDIWSARTRLDLRTPRQWGALKGSTSLKVEIGHWTAQQVVTARCTWLDLDLLRALGSGLAARLWVALEAWGSWPQRTLDGHEECAIGLGEPARQSLGVGAYKRPRAARTALDRAGAQIIAADPGYELVRCEKRAGWCLVVRRLTGARARVAARQGAAWRAEGIAANEHRRQERRQVRELIRRQLSEHADAELAA